MDEEKEGEDPSEVPVDAAVTRELFLEWRSPRFGEANPERMNNPVWEWLIRTRLNAYWANKKLDGPDSMDAGPVWCFDRHGQSSTLLRDGRRVLIAGEHEDSYDPDFYIYNDVVVQNPNGSMEIFGYPREAFPPTDFHSATVAGGKIVLIGSLGYFTERKPGVTQVLTLDVESKEIARVETTGAAPGWIYEHKAELLRDGRSIIVSGGKVARKVNEFVENIDDWKLDVTTWAWERLTERQWMRWRIHRKDNRPNSLWQINSAVFYSSIPALRAEFERTMAELEHQFGARPDLEIAKVLYQPSVPHEIIPQHEEEYNIHRVRVNGVVVRFVEDIDSIDITVEGQIGGRIAEELVADLMGKVSRLENADYVAIAL